MSGPLATPPRDASLTVVIVNYRTAALAIDCLDGLVPQLRELGDARAVVADNASGDDSVARLREAIQAKGWADHVELLALPRNGGFAYGNNRAIEPDLASPRRSDFYLLLNPDTRVGPGALRTLLAYAVAHPEVGVLGPRLDWPDGRAIGTAHLFPSPLRELDRGANIGPVTRALGAKAAYLKLGEGPLHCDWVSGAALWVRREVLEQVGLLDEGFFLYFEEIDFCARARRAGWSVAYVPEARIVHLEGQATGIHSGRPLYWFASRRRFFVKLHGVSGLAAVDLSWGLGRALGAVRRLLTRTSAPADEPRWLAWRVLRSDASAWLRGELAGIPRLRP